MAETRVIKRYANRKLYDTQRSRYVTLEQIADMIRSGDDVKIVDNGSKEDLTSVTLAQIIFEEEKRQKSFLPLDALRNVIQSGGESLASMASKTGERVRNVFRRGDGTEAPIEVALPPEEEEAGGGPAHALKELFERGQMTLDEWQKRVDERIHKVVETLAPWTVLHKELAELSARLSDLEKRLGEAD
jgi:polyhydroxyalkanoate synthesis repressor PhaR